MILGYFRSSRKNNYFYRSCGIERQARNSPLMSIFQNWNSLTCFCIPNTNIWIFSNLSSSNISSLWMESQAATNKFTDESKISLVWKWIMENRLKILQWQEATGLELGAFYNSVSYSWRNKIQNFFSQFLPENAWDLINLTDHPFKFLKLQNTTYSI